MTTTTNYGYTVITGSDSPVNIQNDIAPNFTAIDDDIKNVSDAAITVATHAVSGTVHQLVRADADRNVLYFVATGDMVAGDTFTVDGVPVTARLANAESLATNSFRINNTVMGVLVGTVLNLQVPNAIADASDIEYDNTISGLTANNVQDAIDEIKSDIPTSFAASDVSYDNTTSGLQATNAQTAIDELASARTYRSAETVIGKWIDGSTLYRKCFEGTGVFGSMQVLDASMSPSNTRIVNWNGSWDGSNQCNPFLSTWTGSAQMVVDPLVQTTGLKINIVNMTVTHYILIVDYVKLV